MENQAVQKSKREKLTLQDRPREPDSTDLNRTVKFTQQENWDELKEKLASEAESAEQIERKVDEVRMKSESNSSNLTQPQPPSPVRMTPQPS